MTNQNLSYLTEKDAAKILSVSPKTMQKWRWLCKGPNYKKMGRAVRYTVEDLQAYAEKISIQVIH